MATVAELDEAIKEITDNGQAFTLGDMQYTSANIAALIDYRDQIQREEGQSQGTRPTFRGVNLTAMGY